MQRTSAAVRSVVGAVLATVLLAGCGGDNDEVVRVTGAAGPATAAPEGGAAAEPGIPEDNLRYDDRVYGGSGTIIKRSTFVGQQVWAVSYGASTISKTHRDMEAAVPRDVDDILVDIRPVDCDQGAREGLGLPTSGPAWYSSVAYRTEAEALASRKALTDSGWGNMKVIPVTALSLPESADCG